MRLMRRLRHRLARWLLDDLPPGIVIGRDRIGHWRPGYYVDDGYGWWVYLNLDGKLVTRQSFETVDWDAFYHQPEVMEAFFGTRTGK